MIQKIYIADVIPVKSGEKNGRKWNLYNVVDQKGTKYTTFEAKYGGMVGQEVEVEVEQKQVERNGKTYINLAIVEPQRQSGGFAKPARTFTADEGFTAEDRRKLTHIFQYVKLIQMAENESKAEQEYKDIP